MHLGQVLVYFSASACLFLSYSYTQKGYKVQDLCTHKIFVSRDVHFHETIFPCSLASSIQPIFSYPPLIASNSLPSSSQSPSSTPVTPFPPLRRSTRTSKPHIWSQDYACSNLSSMTTSLYLIFGFLSYSKLSPSYHTFLFPFLLIKNLSLIRRQCLILVGSLPWILNYRL